MARTTRKRSSRRATEDEEAQDEQETQSLGQEDEDEEETQPYFENGDEDDEEEEDPSPKRRRTSGKDKGKGKAKATPAVAVDSSSDMEMEPPRSQQEMTPTQTSFSFTQDGGQWNPLEVIDCDEKDIKASETLEDATKTQLVKQCARFLLLKLTRKELVTKAMLRKLLKDIPGEKAISKTRRFNYVLKEAKDLIEGTFGFTITGTVKDTKHWYKKDTFFLVNHLPHDWLLKCAQAAPEAEMARRGLLMVVMALIYCESKKMILEDKLYANLKKLDSRITWTSEKKRGVPQTPNVPGLGNVGELLTLFEKQCYIRKDRSASKTLDGDDIFEFSLGARFHLEIGGKQMIYFIAQSMEQDPETYLNALREAESSGGEEEEQDEEDE